MDFKMYRVSIEAEAAIISRLVYEKIKNNKSVSKQEALNLILQDEYKRLSQHINFDKLVNKPTVAN